MIPRIMESKRPNELNCMIDCSFVARSATRACRRVDYFRLLFLFQFLVQLRDSDSRNAEGQPQPQSAARNQAVCVHRPDVRAMPRRDRRESFNPAVFVEDESLTITTKYLATSGVFTSRGPAGAQAPRRRPRRRVSL